ncbi:MAG: ferritin family protein [Candidatus Aminicenantales bacterium]|jgi:rubrerythrin
MPDRRFESLNDILAFAVEREIEAARGYGRMAAQAKTPGLRDLLLELKGEEEKHRRLLKKIKAAPPEGTASASVPDMGLSDALTDLPLAADMTFQELLIFAARKEKKAEDLYAGLARRPELAAHRKVFEFLAGQERTHKLKLEAEYETHVLTED